MIEIGRCVITKELVFDLKCVMGLDFDEEMARIIYSELNKKKEMTDKFDQITIIAYGETK